jgi:histone-lysine N-methyltransferase SETMAR
LFARKLIATVFWDRKGELRVEFMQQGSTIKSQVYSETSKKPRRAIQSKKRAMLTSGVVLLHDNASPHATARNRALLQHFNWELFDHPPYSPDLAPSAYDLLTNLKNWLRSESFNNNEELMQSVKTRQSSQAADFSDTGIHKLISRYDKFLNSGGDYVEK